MEVRCGKCNKLFRVSDDKITGTGIKFACTRCGESVKITLEEFEHYTLSKNVVSSPDVLEPKPIVEPARAVAPASAPQPEAELAQAVTSEPKIAAHPVSEQIPKPEPLQPPVPQQETKPAPVNKPIPAPIRASTPVSSTAGQAVPSAAPKKEPVRHAASSERNVVIGAAADASPRSGKLVVILLVALIIIGLVGYGVYAYRTSSSKKGPDTAQELSSIEGLRITNVTGSFDTTGDLLITGVVENSLDQEKTAWYLTVEINNAQGVVLNKIRVLNGKQIYTRRDYDLLAKRGMNIQDLKAKTAQEPDITIPPKGSVTFEVRYVQPPAGIASFNATLQPFDPVRLFKEIAEDLK
jgi:DNA-directed RNA polymerase subunit M/transcription elongation factor TFIIS